MAPVIKNAGERYAAKNYPPVSLFSVVSKVLWLVKTCKQ